MIKHKCINSNYWLKKKFFLWIYIYKFTKLYNSGFYFVYGYFYFDRWQYLVICLRWMVTFILTCMIS